MHTEEKAEADEFLGIREKEKEKWKRELWGEGRVAQHSRSKEVNNPVSL